MEGHRLRQEEGDDELCRREEQWQLERKAAEEKRYIEEEEEEAKQHKQQKEEEEKQKQHQKDRQLQELLEETQLRREAQLILERARRVEEERSTTQQRMECTHQQEAMEDWQVSRSILQRVASLERGAPPAAGSQEYCVEKAMAASRRFAAAAAKGVKLKGNGGASWKEEILHISSVEWQRIDAELSYIHVTWSEKGILDGSIQTHSKPSAASSG